MSVVPLKKIKISYSLLLSKLEKSILSGESVDKCRAILSMKDIWMNLSEKQALSWARLAQIAGQTDVALDVLSWLNSNYPDFQEGWKEHWDILNILGERQRALQLRSMAISQYNIPPSLFVLSDYSNSDIAEEVIKEPFVRYDLEQNLLNLFKETFQGREDCFARQWVNKTEHKQGYVPVRRGITLEDIKEHLLGRKTYGIYLLREDSTVLVSVLDVDLGAQYRDKRLSSETRNGIKREKNYILRRIPELSQDLNFYPLIEFSGGKGYHFWYFFKTPQPAKVVREAMLVLRQKISPDLSYFEIEVFPKQDRIEGKGLGNLVKLPLGIHRLTGKPSYFWGYKNSSVWEQIQLLEKIKKISSQDLENMPLGLEDKKVIVHPRYEQWANDYPELAILKEKCTALSQIFSVCLNSRELSLREEKVLFGTIGFLSRKRVLLHYLLKHLPDYNPHLVDYKLSRLRGTPLGCKKIHALLELNIDFCLFEQQLSYAHPLLHCPDYSVQDMPKQEKVENLTQALEQLSIALEQVKRFLPQGVGA